MTASPPPPNHSEQTPLLAAEAGAKQPNPHDAVYERFSPRKKRVIVALVSWCGLIPLFASGTFIPSIPEIAKDLNTTGSVISLAVSFSIFAGCLGALMGASYSTFYGRRPTYLLSLPLLTIGSLGVALSTTIPQLMTFRFLQALGASPGMAVGAGVIGDVYRLEERGRAMGVFFAAILLGPALAPPIGGLASEYLSWRLLQGALALAGLGAYFAMWVWFPETCHPGTRGVDLAARKELEAGGGVEGSGEEGDGKAGKRWKWVWINPLKPLWLLRSPNLLGVSLAGFFVLLTDYVLLVPLAYTIGPKYGITNPAIIGMCFIPAGLGNMIGAPLAGRISDSIVIRWRTKRNGVWYPEDRLRATLFGAAVLVPLSVLGSGLITQYGPGLEVDGTIGLGGKIGLGLNLVCLFLNGMGVDMVLSPSAAYVVDVMHGRSAESMAANTGFRSLLLSPAIACVLPMVEMYGVAWTDGLSALFSVLGLIILLAVIRYGNEMRAWVDVGYSTADTN